MAKRLENGLFIATDVPEGHLRNLIVNTHSLDRVRGYVLTAANAIDMGLSYVVSNIEIVAPNAIRAYDHQSAGADIPENAPRFMRSLQRAGIHSVFLYPSQANDISKAWIEAAQNQQLEVVVGGERSYHTSLSRRASAAIYEQAARLGVREFGVPANKPKNVEYYRDVIEQAMGSSEGFTLIGTGLGPQGGSVDQFAPVAGKNWHVVVGRDIFNAENVQGKTQQYADQIQQYS